MKDVLRFIVILTVSAACFSEDISNNNHDEEAYIGNPDDFAIIERPCQVYDLDCIRGFFAKHARCTIANGPLPDPLPRSQNTIYLSRINVTVTENNLIMTGFNNTRIEEFYINRATNKVVFAIQVRDLTSSTTAYFRFFRRGREPITSVANTSILYRSLTITAVIPNIDDMQLDKAEFTTYADDGAPPFYIGPEVASNPDPVVAQSVAELLLDMPTDVQEIMLTEGMFFSPTYIQINICDFGLKVA